MIRFVLIATLWSLSFAIYCQDQGLTEFEADYQASLALYEESKLLIAEESYEQAIDFLQQAHEFYKGSSDYTFAAAFALYKLDRLKEAAKKIQWSLNLEPFQSDYHVMAGNIAYKRMIYEDAANFYSKALQYQDSSEVAIDDLGCIYNRGNCFLQLEQFKKAESDFSEVLTIDSLNYMAFHNRAQTRLRLNNLAGACEDFRLAINAGSEISGKYLLKYCQ